MNKPTFTLEEKRIVDHVLDLETNARLVFNVARGNQFQFVILATIVFAWAMWRGYPQVACIGFAILLLARLTESFRAVKSQRLIRDILRKYEAATSDDH